MRAVWALAPLVVALIASPALDRLLRRNAGWALAAAYLASAALFAPSAIDALGGYHDTLTMPWVPSLGVSLAFRMDGLAVVFGYIALLVGAVVLAYSTRYLDDRPHPSFYVVMVAFTVAMLTLCLADDLVVLFICWELTSIASFLLIARSGPPGEPGSMRTLFITVIGGLALLAAIVLMVSRTGTSNLRAVLSHPVFGTDHTFAAVVAVLVLIAGFTKAAQFPFHVWLPDAMSATTPVSAYLHAAAVVKAGIFLLLRFSVAFHSVPVWRATLIAVGLLTAAIGALFAVQQTDLKKVMAYSTVSQLGLIVSMIGVGTPYAVAVAVLHTIAHAMFKSGLFMMVGVIDRAAGTRDVRRLPELRSSLPGSFWLTVLGAGSMAGIPPLLGFVSKEALFDVLLRSPGAAVWGWLALAAGVFVSILTFAYCTKIVLGGFVDGRDDREITTPERTLVVAAAIPILLGIPLGFLPDLLSRAVGRAAEVAVPGTLDEDPSLELWHGFTVPLFATLVVFTAGILILVNRRRVWPRVEHSWLPFDGASVIGAIDRGVGRSATRVARWVAPEHASRHVTPVILALVGALGIGSLLAFTGGPLPSRIPGQDRAIDLVVLVLVAIAVVVVCRSNSRLAATVALGAVGVVATVQILALGAPDVGLTMLLVETLTVVILMLALQRLPRTFGRASRRRSGSTWIIAVAAGCAAALGTWTLTGRRERSDLAEYFLTQAGPLTGGDNVVNVILVEFRAMDTFGEVAVLGLAGIAIVALFSTIHPTRLDPTVGRASLPPLRAAPGTPAYRSIAPAWSNVLALQLLLRVLTPLLAVISGLIFLRGHNEPGGGFIAALVGAAIIGLIYLSHSEDRPVGGGRAARWLIGGGLLVAIATGLAGLLVKGSFLQPLHGYVFGIHVTTSMLFDVGVYTAVLGLAMIAFNLLGTRSGATLEQATSDVAQEEGEQGPEPAEHRRLPVGTHTTYLVDGIDPEKED